MINRIIVYFIIALILAVFFAEAQSKAPGRPTVYAFEPFAFPGEIGDQSMYVDSATAATTGQWQLQDRKFCKQTVTPNPNPLADITVSAFKSYLESGMYKVVWINTHGSTLDNGHIDVEPYGTVEAAQHAYNKSHWGQIFTLHNSAVGRAPL